jgi:hypothetical protein
MGCKPIRIGIISRVLIRREIEDIHIGGNDNDAARVLARRALDAAQRAAK